MGSAAQGPGSSTKYRALSTEMKNNTEEERKEGDEDEDEGRTNIMDEAT